VSHINTELFDVETWSVSVSTSKSMSGAIYKPPTQCCSKCTFSFRRKSSSL